MNKIDLNKKYRTRDGRAVRVLCVDRGDNAKVFPFRVVALVDEGNGFEQVFTFDEFGRSRSSDDPLDLVELPPRIQRKVWVNMYDTKDGFIGGAYSSREQADMVTCEDRLACVELDIDVEEGHGL